MTTSKTELVANTKDNHNNLVESEQKDIIQKIQEIDDLSLLIKINYFIDKSAEAEDKDEYDELLEEVLDEMTGDNEPLQHHIHEKTETNPLERFEHILAFPVFMLSLTMLIVMGLILFFIIGNDRFDLDPLIANILYSVYWILEAVFVLEFLLLLYLKIRYAKQIRKRQMFYRFLMLIFPPYRIAKAQLLHKERVWLPFLGWTKNNDALFEHLRRRFSMPMILIAFLIIPILIVPNISRSTLLMCLSI